MLGDKVDVRDAADLARPPPPPALLVCCRFVFTRVDERCTRSGVPADGAMDMARCSAGDDEEDEEDEKDEEDDEYL